MQDLEAIDSTSISFGEIDWLKYGSLLGTLPTDTPFKRSSIFESSTGDFESNLVKRRDHSQALHEIQSQVFAKRLLQPFESDEPSRVDIAREHRLELLAKKYEGVGLTKEDEARIAILTQRLRRLTPRVNHVAWTIAEESVTQLEGVSARIDEISAKYGL